MARSNKVRSIYGPALARIFSSTVIEEFASRGCSPLTAAVLKESDLLGEFAPTTLLCDFFDQIYALLFRSYRNEYIYKNAIACKVLLGVHSLKTASMLTEFRAGPCKADAVVLNGTSTVYEIKSAYDSVERLTRQIAAYRLVFDRINVITSESQLDKVAGVVGEDVGLMLLTDRYSIKTIRESLSLKTMVSPEVIFDSLRKEEYEQVVASLFGKIPQVSNARMYQACRDLFCELDPVVAHDAMVAVLKKRNGGKRLHDFVMSMPVSLTAASLSCKLGVAGQTRFVETLNKPLWECLAI